jgi:hypothetical protein
VPYYQIPYPCNYTAIAQFAPVVQTIPSIQTIPMTQAAFIVPYHPSYSMPPPMVPMPSQVRPRPQNDPR